MRICFWVGTLRLAGKGRFAGQSIKKGTRIIQDIWHSIAKAETAKRFYHCLSRRLEHTLTLETKRR
jgi:hypothetical protein